MRSKPVHESGTACAVNLAIPSKLDCRILNTSRIVVSPITIDDQSEQWPKRRYEGTGFTSLMGTINARTDEPAERAVLVEHGATAHAGAETGAHAVTRKRQDGSITGVGGAQHALHFLLHARDFVGEIEGATVL